MTDGRLPVVRKALAEIIGDECRHWESDQCGLAGCEDDPESQDGCWCWQKARCACDAIDDLAHAQRQDALRDRFRPQYP